MVHKASNIGERKNGSWTMDHGPLKIGQEACSASLHDHTDFKTNGTARAVYILCRTNPCAFGKTA
jgi:hypothetical protein